MKRILYTTFILIFATSFVQAQDIEYGYNMQGQYVPIAIGGEKIEYGYNMQGQYVPVAIGDRKIQYGYNIQGQYVMTGIEDPEPQYNYTRSYTPQTWEDYKRCEYAAGIAGWSGNRNFMNMCR